MATTIKLKNGSGAPLAGDLVQGEPALDLTNKRLYTENASGTVIEVGTNPTSLTTGTFTSTGIDDNATSTAITIDSSENVGIGTASPSYKLHVSQASSGALVNSFADDLFVESGTHAGITVGSGATSTGNLAFTDSGNNFVGYVQYNHADNSMRLGANASEVMRIDSSGNVGIGTSSPSALLHARGLNSLSSGTGYRKGWIGGAASWGSGSYEELGLGFSAFRSIFTGADNWDLAFATGTSTQFSAGTQAERMRINSSGLALIGHTTGVGSNKLQVTSNKTAYSEAGISLVTGNGISAVGSNGPRADIDVKLSNNWRTNLLFKVRQSDSDGAPTEAMRIDSSGNLLVGRTSSSTTVAGAEIRPSGAVVSVVSSAENMYINRLGTDGGLIRFANDSVTCGLISCSGATTTYGTSSDARLKDNIVDAPAGNIDAIRVRSFDWKADGSHQTYGMVAQELVDVAPEAVTQGETEDDMWAVDYSKLVPMMIKEIQDLKAEVAALKGA